jgi:hypothetical protein
MRKVGGVDAPADVSVTMHCFDARIGKPVSHAQEWRPRASPTVPICWNQCRLFEPIGDDPTKQVDDDGHLMEVWVMSVCECACVCACVSVCE